MSNIHIEGLEEIGRDVEEILEGVRDNKISVGHAQIAIMRTVKSAHIPAYKALQEEVERLHSRAIDFAQKGAALETKVATLEAQLSALQAGEPVAEACYSGEESDYLTCLLLKPVKQGTKLYTAAPAIKQQAGYITVPEWPTDAMCDAGREEQKRWPLGASVLDIYRAMVKTTPTQSVSANQPDSGKVPPGYALVPVEITPEMEKAWMDAFNNQLGRRLNKNRRLKRHLSGKQDQSCETVAYRAMLAASPSAPIAEGDES